MTQSCNVAIPQGIDHYPGVVTRWFAVAILSLSALQSYGNRYIINLVESDVLRAFALTDWSVSLVMGGGFVVLYALFGVPLGRVADRMNRRNLIIAGVALWCASTAVCAVTTTFAQLIVARMFVGLGQAVLMPAATSLIADSFPPLERGRALSAFHVGAVLGGGLSLGLLGVLMTDVEHGLLDNMPLLQGLPAWRNIMLLVGFTGLPLCLLLLSVREPARHGMRGPQRLSVLVHASLARRGRVARTCLAVGLVAAGDYGLLSWLPTDLERAYGIHADRSGQLIGLMLVGGGLAGCVSSGWLADYFARKRGLPARIWAMRLSYCACLLSLPLFLAGSASGLLVGAAAWVFGSVSAFVTANVYLSETVANNYRATTIALCNICSAVVGIGLGPTLVVALSRLMPGGSDGGLRLGITSLCGLAIVVALGLLSWRVEKESVRDE